IVPVLTEPGAPAAPADLVVTPDPMGALGATITWTNPALTFDGETLTELTSVSLWVNDETTAEYENTSPVIAGSETYAYTAATPGLHNFSVYGTNAAGEGAQASQTVWLGADVPAAPTNAVLAKDNMEAQLSWDAPTVGMNGGFFDGTGVTYDVYRNPGDVQVATAQTGTTFTETLTVPGNYSYKVVASNAAGLGGNATSNILLIGNFVVYEMFDGATIPEGWTTQGLGLTNWSIVTTAKAGGDANELKFYWSPLITGTSYFVSPVINTTGMSSLGLNYKDLFDDYNTNPKTIGIKTTTDGGATWLVANEEVMANGNVDIGPRDNTVVIENAHVGSADFQFAIFYDGYTFDVDGWYIDNIELIDRAGANITFTVQEGTTLLEGAEVTINENNYTTAADGTVTAYVLVGTDIPYTVTKLGFGDETGTITVVDGVDQDVTVEMTSLPTYEVTFNIMNENSTPLNALVTLELAGNEVASEVATGGTVVFSGIPDGDYTYTVTMQLYLPETGSFTVDGADLTVPDITLAADPDIIIGTGAVTGKPYPINGFYGFSYSQSIYLKSEIADMPMTITHVKYYFNGTSLNKSNDWTIYMGHTTKSEFTGTADWVTIDELTQVYSGEFDSPTGQGWIEFDIEDFDFNGFDNLVIAVDENKSGYNGSSDRFLCTGVTGTRSIAYYSDSSNPDPASPPAASRAPEAFIPNTILTAYPKAGAEVTFIVTDGVNPLEEAVVGINTKTYTTDASGTAVIYVGEGADVPYTVNKFGFEEYTGTVTVVDGVIQDVNVTMVALPVFDVTLNIKNTLDDPLDATVTVYFGETEIESETAVAGEIVFADIPVGSYTFDVAFEGYVTQTNLSLEVADAPVTQSVVLVEIMETPYALMVNVNNAEQSAELIWNAGDMEFADSFEDGTFDAWAEYVQGPGTPGTDGPNPFWHVASQTAPDGGKVCFSDWGYNIDTWIISESLVVEETTTLSFWWNASYYWSVSPQNNGDLHVQISTDGGTNWTSIWTEDDEPEFTNFTWMETVLDLSEYAGTVKIAFNYVSSDGATQGLDNIIFTDVPRKAGTVAVSNAPNVLANAKTAKGANYTFTKASKAFVGYNVYLEDLVTPVTTTPIEETTYVFEGLDVGTYTAGVEAVYTTGTTEIVTVDFEVKSVYTVTLTLVDGETDTPIDGATVIINENEQTTDADGVVTFSLIDGTYAYTATKAGYVDAAGEIVVDGDNVEQTIALSPGYTVTLTVVDGTSPIDGATVIFNEGEGLTTDDNGKVVISDVINGNYSYTVTKAGYVEVTGEIVVDGDDVQETIALTDDIVAPIDLQVIVDGTNATFTYQVSGGGGGGESFTESFEESVPPAGWTLDNTNSVTWVQAQTISFDTGDIVPVDGSHQAYLYWDFSNQNEWLITPSFTVPTGANLTFWSYTGAFGSPNGDHYYVKVSTNDGSTWTPLWDAVDSAGEDYEEVTVDLSAYQGQDVKLAWQAVDGDGQGLWFSWFIDYITVGNEKGAVSFDGELKFVSNGSSSSSVVSERPFSRDGSVVAVSNKSTKAFVGHTIYLDDMTTPLEEGVAGYSYDFTGLTVGNHTAGVQRVYTTGASDVVTIDFKVGHTVTFTVTDGTNAIEGATISINSVDLTTNEAGVATIELPDGTYSYTATMLDYYDATGNVVVNGADVSKPIEMVPTGIDSGFLSNLKVYPNPFSNEISITNADKVNRVIITNIVGQRLMDITLNGSETINTSELTSGIYLVTFEGNNGESTVRKMIKR
ncbi:MAG: choice-of-anchor J domain-containing protein, partial [Bacteroidales bacterium]|nr:choice-of-anchor J domain-containing protein [Bacteroidales bacterium]